MVTGNNGFDSREILVDKIATYIDFLVNSEKFNYVFYSRIYNYFFKELKEINIYHESAMIALLKKYKSDKFIFSKDVLMLKTRKISLSVGKDSEEKIKAVNDTDSKTTAILTEIDAYIEKNLKAKGLVFYTDLWWAFRKKLEIIGIKLIQELKEFLILHREKNYQYKNDYIVKNANDINIKLKDKPNDEELAIILEINAYIEKCLKDRESLSYRELWGKFSEELVAININSIQELKNALFKCKEKNYECKISYMVKSSNIVEEKTKKESVDERAAVFLEINAYIQNELKNKGLLFYRDIYANFRDKLKQQGIHSVNDLKTILLERKGKEYKYKFDYMVKNLEVAVRKTKATIKTEEINDSDNEKRAVIAEIDAYIEEYLKDKGLLLYRDILFDFQKKLAKIGINSVYKLKNILLKHEAKNYECKIGAVVKKYEVVEEKKENKLTNEQMAVIAEIDAYIAENLEAKFRRSYSDIWWDFRKKLAIIGINSASELKKFLLERKAKKTDVVTADNEKTAEINKNEYSKPEKPVHRWNAPLMSKEEFKKRMMHDVVEKHNHDISQSNDYQNTELADRCKGLLRSNFVDGYKMNAIHLNRFKKLYQEKYAEGISVADESLEKLLQKISVKHDGRLFVKDEAKQSELLNEIVNKINAVFTAGGTCVYIDAVYEKYKIKLGEEIHIYNPDALKEILFGNKSIEFYCDSSKYGLSGKYGKQNFQKDLLNYFKEIYESVTYSKILEDFWYITPSKIKQTIYLCSEIVNVATSEYFYAPNTPINTEEKNKLIMALHQKFSGRSFLTSKEFYALFQKTLPSVASSMAEFNEKGVRKIFGYLLKREFNFNGTTLTERGKFLSKSDVYREICSEQDVITLSDLKELVQDANLGNIDWDIVHDEMVRCSVDEFRRCDLVSFDVDAVDGVLADIWCQHGFVPLKKVGLFSHFPPMEIPWNEFLLESFIYSYSKKFKLIHTCFSEMNVYGAIVSDDSDIDDYDSLIIKALVNSNDWNNRESALEYIVKEGFQAVRRYKNIDMVVREAKLQREKLNR